MQGGADKLGHQIGHNDHSGILFAQRLRQIFLLLPDKLWIFPGLPFGLLHEGSNAFHHAILGR